MGNTDTRYKEFVWISYSERVCSQKTLLIFTKIVSILVKPRFSFYFTSFHFCHSNSFFLSSNFPPPSPAIAQSNHELIIYGKSMAFKKIGSMYNDNLYVCGQQWSLKKNTFQDKITPNIRY